MNQFNKKNIWLALIPTVVTGNLIRFFLSGKIIYIPQGTPNGGESAAVGVLVIIVSVSVISFLIIRILNNKINK